MRYALLLGFWLAASLAHADCSYGPTDFLVFSLGTIHEENSDFQGLTGAAGDITLDSFAIAGSSAQNECASALTGGDFTLTHGQVQHGGVQAAGNLAISNALVDGDIYYGGKTRITEASVGSSHHELTDPVHNLSTLAQSYLAASERVAQIPLPLLAPVQQGGALVFEGSGDMRAFSIDAEQLHATTQLLFKGAPTSLFVVNVQGGDVNIDHQDMILQDGITAGQILFNFPDATHLRIAYSGSQTLGMAMTVLAPKAATELTSCRITGGLYVGSLEGDGQVNPGPFPWGQIPVPSPCPCPCPSPTPKPQPKPQPNFCANVCSIF